MAITVPSGLEGVVAFQTTIAEPDKEGGALRYRGVDIEDLVGSVPFEKVWGLLVDGKFEPGMPPADPDHVKAIDAYWISAAEHGMNASTFTARVVASTGADVAAALSAAVGALSGPLHGGAPSRVLQMLDDVGASGDAETYVKQLLD